MKKISIHIGLPKTATTYIQKTLSSQNSYLGLESNGSVHTEHLFSIFVKYSKGRSVEKDLVEWWGQVNDYIDSYGTSFPVVFSSEYFFSGDINGFPEFPFVSSPLPEDRLVITEFLKFMSEVLSKEVMIGAVFDYTESTGVACL